MTAKRNIEPAQIQKYVIENPWRNVYWFARMLISSDKYGGIGSDSKILSQISSQLRIALTGNMDCDTENRLSICKKLVRKLLEERHKRAISKITRVRAFCNDLEKKLVTLDDVAVFILTSESVMIPINNALMEIPNNDREYTTEIAKTYLDELGNKGLATVVNLWDDFGVEGCLNAERTAVVREFARLRYSIAHMPECEANMILTAFVQEFERRLGQKRKGRAGGSLEDVVSFLFGYYNIKATHAPEHFQADIEVDRWVKCKDGWLVGISCKRTLRERWKQVSSADRGVLSRYKIRTMLHLMTYDEDLSDDKIVTLGEQGHIFYLRDDSRKLLSASAHVGMKDYVRPMSAFIIDTKREQGR